jgi:hypothetical protein
MKVRAFGGRGSLEPLHMAEFLIGRHVGVPIGHDFKRCVAGQNIAGKIRLHPDTKKPTIPFSVARDEFIRARAEQVYDPDSTVIPGWGVYERDREPSFVGQIMWQPSAREPGPGKFLRNMANLCEILACRLAQRSVMARFWQPGRPARLLRCSPLGAKFPVEL